MVEFDHGPGQFNYRVAGVAIHNGRVLLDRNTRNAYWVLPGGHPEMMEPMAAALKREYYEEVGAKIEVARLLWVVENFFQQHHKPVHELSFYFLVHLDPSSPLLRSDGPFYGEEHNHKLIFQWYPLDRTVLSALPIMPGFLASALPVIPSTPEHIVIDEVVRRASPRNEVPTGQLEKEKKISAFTT